MPNAFQHRMRRDCEAAPSHNGTPENMLSREKMTPSPEDLAHVLVAGTFEAKDARVSGHWPLDRRFVEGLLR